MCKFSIIVPCYNIEEHIEELFDMFQNKDYCDYEVIFVDDCSTDKTFNNLLSIGKPYERFHFFQTSENGGPGVARNVGLKNANGNYVLFCDCDDVIDIAVLNNISAFLDEHEDADLLVFPYAMNRRGNNRDCDEFSKYNHGDMVRVVDVAADSGMPWAKVFKRKIIDDNNIQFPARKSGEDKCFVVTYCIFIDKVFKLDFRYYTYVMNNMSLTHRKQQEQNFTTTFEILQAIYQEYFPEIVARMYAETFLLTYAKHFSEIKERSKRIKEFYKLENIKHPNWIKNVDYDNQSLYRKLIYKAMYKNCPRLIKLIMWLRRKKY